ncbi:MAG: DUF481 domain-containing protein [Saprospiraceae bacterium]|nr:DUF481 domain-containing protein [Saprospiraceae bacterium]
MKGTTRCVIAIALLLAGGSAMAQINESDTARFQMRISLTGIYQNGNVEVATIRSKADVLYAPTKHLVFKSQNVSLYQAFYSNKADNDVFSRNYLYFHPRNKIYPFAIGYLSGNFRRKIDLRYFAGAGATLQIRNTPAHVMKVSASVVYEATRFNSTVYNFSEYNGADKITLWRGTAYLGGWSYLLGRRLRFFYDAYWQPAFGNTRNYRSQFDIGADFPVWKGCSFSMLYTYMHENVVVEKIKKDDRILTFGFAYQIKVNRN